MDCAHVCQVRFAKCPRIALIADSNPMPNGIDEAVEADAEPRLTLLLRVLECKSTSRSSLALTIAAPSLGPLWKHCWLRAPLVLTTKFSSWTTILPTGRAN